MTDKPYCRPLNAGLQSEDTAVARRIGRLLTTLDTEINAFIVDGQIRDDLHEFRYYLMWNLERDGWSMSYDGSDRMKVRAPGHKRPFTRRTMENGHIKPDLSKLTVRQ